MGEVTERTLLKKGAEASLYFAEWHGKNVIIKSRFPKKYRHEKLDKTIRTYRTIHEPQLIHEGKKAGVSTPSIYLVDVRNAVIIMEFIEGKQLKELLGDLPSDQRKNICIKIGELIAKLHKNGIIHGDLTTSNMILNDEGKIFMIDFGLGEKNAELEAKGVDLHLMKHALQSTHFQCAEECFQAIVKGYTSVSGEKETKDVLDKIQEIERRGRYVAERKQNLQD